MAGTGPVVSVLVAGWRAGAAGWLTAAVLWLGALWLSMAVWRALRMLWISRHIPGMAPFRIVLRSAAGLNGHPSRMMGKILSGYKAFGSPWRLWFGPFLAVFLREPDDIQEILSNPATQDKPALYESVVAILGPGLININGDTFRRHRKALSPSFQMSVLRSFIPLFNGAARNLCREFEERARTGEVFNSTDSFKRVTTDVVLEAFLCCDKTDLQEQRDMIVKVVSKVNEMMMYFVQRPWFWNRTVRRLFPYYKEYAELVDFIDYCTRTALDKKIRLMREDRTHARNAPEPAEEEPAAAGDPMKLHKKALLDHIVSSDNFRMLDKEELIAELKHICAAALGTTSDLMSFLIIILALEPEVQERVYEELMEVFDGDQTRPVTHEHVERLEYMERVIMEVLRWFPAVPALARNAKTDVTLPSGCVIPAGSYIVIMLRAVHMNPTHHSDPYTFDPDRFLPENMAGLPKFAYLPFSDGTRACPGKRWGMVYTKILAANFLRQFRVLPDPHGYQTLREIKTVLGISLAPEGGASVRVERRQPPPQQGGTRGS